MLRRKHSDSTNWFVRHSLSIVLLVILVIHMIGFHFTTLPAWIAIQEAHGRPTNLWPGYWVHYGAGIFHGMFADTYGALILVLLTKWFYEQGSAESSEGNP